MDHTLAILLLAAVCLGGLVLVPFGLPGLWVMVLGVLGYGWLTEFRTVGFWTVTWVVLLAMAGEVIESWLGFSFAKRYGGGSRAGWGALLGGIVGAIVGIPIPILGSIAGAFVGSFIGAAAFEYTRSRQAGVALNAGWGAVLGRAAAPAVKVGLGVAIVVIALFAVLRNVGSQLAG
jgi:uncharacterized protein YqgC (DUF456 family)